MKQPACKTRSTAIIRVTFNLGHSAKLLQQFQGLPSTTMFEALL